MPAPISMDRRDLLLATAAATGLMALPQRSGAKTASNILSARVMAGTKGRPLLHYWSHCVGAGRANEGLRAGWLEQLALVHQQCGFRYCRFHGLFHDDMFVVKIIDGSPVYNWQYVDELFDRLLRIGVKPFVELGFMPKDLASTEKTQFWWKGNISPPKNQALWGDLVAAFVRHCIERYGAEEVRSWYFEVWNEPNLHVFWDGTRSQYFDLYRTSVRAIKAIDPNLRVGGPATSNFVGDDRFAGDAEDKSKHRTNLVDDMDSLEWEGVWIREFLSYCAAEKLPVDFVSTHPYPTDFALNPETGRNKGRTRNVNATRQDLTWLRKAVKASAFPNAEIHLTEWSSSPSSRDFTHDYLQAAAYILKVNFDCLGLADSLSYWTFTDVFEELGAGSAAFHGGFGMVSYQGIPKPAFHAYRMLNALGDEIVHREDGLIVTRNANDGKYIILAYNFPSEVKTALSFGDQATAETMYNTGSARVFDITLEGLPRDARFELEVLDKGHGDAMAAWKAMGSPQSPTQDQIAALLTQSWDLNKETLHARSASLRINRELGPWACILIKQG